MRRAQTGGPGPVEHPTDIVTVVHLDLEVAPCRREYDPTVAHPVSRLGRPCGSGWSRSPRSSSRGRRRRRGNATDADAGRRPGEDDVAGEQRQHRGELGDQPRDREDEIARAPVLHHLAVDRAAESEVVRVGELVGGHQPRPHRSVTAVRLAERELTRRCELQGAIGDVLADGQSCHMGPGIVLGHPIGPDPDHGDQFDLPVHRGAGELHRIEGAGQAGRELGERCRHRGCLGAGLLGVGRVVEADGEDLARGRYRRGQLHLVERRGRRTGQPRGEGAHRPPVVVEGLDIRPDAPVGRHRQVHAARLGHHRAPAIQVRQLHLTPSDIARGFPIDSIERGAAPGPPPPSRPGWGAGAEPPTVTSPGTAVVRATLRRGSNQHLSGWRTKGDRPLEPDRGARCNCADTRGALRRTRRGRRHLRSRRGIPPQTPVPSA